VQVVFYEALLKVYYCLLEVCTTGLGL